MTGYGAGTASSANYRITVELKSLNNRYLELGLKLSRVYMKYEHSLRSLIGKALGRGKVSMYITVEVLNPDKRSLQINEILAKAYLSELQKVGSNLGLKTDISLEYLLTLPEIIPTDSAESDPEEWALIQEATQKALSEILVSRGQEGEALSEDLAERVAEIRKGLDAVAVLAPERLQKVRDRIHTTLEEMVDRNAHDPNRFEQELAYYMEKLDVNEEIVRLTQHLTYFEEVRLSNESTGKKLNFIAQEMGREINTIGSKANDAGIQRHVVRMKDELDRIKEQVLNIV